MFSCPFVSFFFFLILVSWTMIVRGIILWCFPLIESLRKYKSGERQECVSTVLCKRLLSVNMSRVTSRV